MHDVLTAIKKDFSPEWIFPLGCYHPSRHKKFEVIDVWGSDYKGWIFNYTAKMDSIKNLNNNLTSFDLSNGFTNVFKNLLKHTEELEMRLANLRKKWREEKDPSTKREFRIKAYLLKSELEKAYAMLLKERQQVARNNHLPADYKEKLSSFERLVAINEQEWRFRQVREYIEENVYAQLR